MKNILFISAFLVAFASCKNDQLNFTDISTSDLHPEFAIPLISSTLSFDNLVPETMTDGYMTTGADGLITLVYNSEVYSLEASDLVHLDNQSFTYSFTLPQNMVDVYNALPPGKTLECSIDISMPLDWTSTYNIQVDSLLLKGGLLSCDVITPFYMKGSADVMIAGLSNDQQPLVCSLDLLLPHSEVDLSGISFSSKGLPVGALPVAVNAKLIKQPNLPLSVTSVFSVSLQIENPEFKYIYGSFDQFYLPIETDTIDLDFFDNAYSGMLTLNNADLTFTFTNSFGIGLNANDLLLQASAENGVSMALSAIPVPFNIAAQQSPASASAVTSLNLSHQNSNLTELLSMLPNKLTYSLNAGATPSGERAFIMDTSRLQINVAASLPLEGITGSFSMQDTFDFALPAAIAQVQFSTLKVITQNGFPLAADVQIFFADEHGRIIDSLFSGPGENIIAAAETNASGMVTNPSTMVTEITMPAAWWNHIYEEAAAKIIVRGSLSSPPNTAVSIYSNYSVAINAGLSLQINP